jgi:hypothetical protein
MMKVFEFFSVVTLYQLSFALFIAADTPPQKKIKLEGSAPGTPSSNTPRGSVSGGPVAGEPNAVPAPVVGGACKSSASVNQVREMDGWREGRKVGRERPEAE